MDQNRQTLGVILEFIKFLGIEVVEEKANPEKGSEGCPGLRLDHGVLHFVPKDVLYPGDALYVAACLALCRPSARETVLVPATFSNDQIRIAHAAATGAWCYAACVHLQLPARVVFHEGGFQGQGEWLVQSYEGGQHFGLPVLERFGMALSPRNAGTSVGEAYPQMMNWLRLEDAFDDMAFVPDRKAV